MFSKPVLTLIGILIIALSASGFFIKKLLEQNAVLEADNKTKNEQLLSMEQELLSQEERFETTLKTLEQREKRIKNIENNNSDLKRKLQEISANDQDECINRNHDPSITDLLRPHDEVPGETSTSVPSGAIN